MGDPGCFLMVALERRFGDILAVWLRCDRRCCIWLSGEATRIGALRWRWRGILFESVAVVMSYVRFEEFRFGGDVGLW